MISHCFYMHIYVSLTIASLLFCNYVHHALCHLVICTVWSAYFQVTATNLCGISMLHRNIRATRMHNVSSWCIACIVSAMEFCHTLPFYCFTYDYEDRDLLPQFCIGATRRLIFSPIFLYELFISNTGRKVIVFFYLWIKPKR
jgi:hypothetical protein